MLTYFDKDSVRSKGPLRITLKDRKLRHRQWHSGRRLSGSSNWGHLLDVRLREHWNHVLLGSTGFGTPERLSLKRRKRRGACGTSKSRERLIFGYGRWAL